MMVPAEEPDQHQRRQQALAAAQVCMDVLYRQFGATRVVLFGSLAGQGPWHSRSDIDLAVEGIEPGLFFRAGAVCDRLVPPDIAVDLVDLKHVSPTMRARILGEREIPNDQHEALRSLIADEFLSLHRIIERSEETLAQCPDVATNQTALYALGAYLQGFCTAIETIFKRIGNRSGGDKYTPSEQGVSLLRSRANLPPSQSLPPLGGRTGGGPERVQRIVVYHQGTLPSGEHWHREQLNLMGRGQEGGFSAVIDANLRDALEDYRKFRHFFRNVYDEDLAWDQMRPKVERLADTANTLHAQVMAFLDQK